MSINKDCWVKKEEHRLFGKLIYQKTIYCDQSIFQKDEEDAVYILPRCFSRENIKD